MRAGCTGASGRPRAWSWVTLALVVTQIAPTVPLKLPWCFLAHLDHTSPSRCPRDLGHRAPPPSPAALVTWYCPGLGTSAGWLQWPPRAVWSPLSDQCVDGSGLLSSAVSSWPSLPGPPQSVQLGETDPLVHSMCPGMGSGPVHLALWGPRWAMPSPTRAVPGRVMRACAAPHVGSVACASS